MKISARLMRVFLLLGIVSFIFSQSTVACPYCFGIGAEDSSMADGMRLAIASLLGVTGTVLGAFAYFFLRLMRKSSRSVESSDHPGTIE